MDPWRLALVRYLRMSAAAEVLAPLGIGCSNAAAADSIPLLSSIESQQRFLDSILRNSYSQKYPPSAKYTARILKLLIDALGSNYEVLEELMEMYFELSTTKPVADGSIRNVIYKTWLLDCEGLENESVTIRMADQLDSVGLTSWRAGFTLADFISANPELMRGKQCLELGSGVGLTGIVFAKLNLAKRLVLSDYTTEVLNNMRSNIELNGVPSVEAIQLDWDLLEDPSTDPYELVPFTPDILMAADCVYDTVLSEKLASVLSHFLKRPDAKEAVAYIASTVRNPTTFQYFLDQLKVHSLLHEDITASVPFNNLFEEPHDGVVLSRISLGP